MIKQITREELQRMREAQEKFVLVDVLSRESYDQEHIPGSISIPLAGIKRLALRLLDRKETIVTYCANFECKASSLAAQELEAMGFTCVLDYKGGLKDYKEGGLALEGSLHECASCDTCCSCG